MLSLRREVARVECHAQCSPPLRNELTHGMCPHCGASHTGLAWDEATITGAQLPRFASKWEDQTEMYFSCPSCHKESTYRDILLATPKLPEASAMLVDSDEVKRLASTVTITEAARLLT